MARAKSDPTPEDLFLAPLRKIALRDPEIEAYVFWAAEGWPDGPSEALESEEVAFYIEGLIPEGFHIEWRALAVPGVEDADHIRLYLWEEGTPPPAEGAEWQILAQGRWVAP